MSGNPFKLIVFNLQKEDNVGMMLRSAYAFGCQEAIVVGRKKFKYTGASGTYKRLEMRHFFNMAEAAAYCHEQGFTVYGVEIGGEELGSCSFDHPAAFVLGNEGRGLSDAQDYCDRIVTIPQWGGVPSLNVAVACGIVLHEFQRRQGKPVADINGQKYVDGFYTCDQQPD